MGSNSNQRFAQPCLGDLYFIAAPRLWRYIIDNSPSLRHVRLAQRWAALRTSLRLETEFERIGNTTRRCRDRRTPHANGGTGRRFSFVDLQPVNPDVTKTFSKRLRAERSLSSTHPKREFGSIFKLTKRGEDHDAI